MFSNASLINRKTNLRKKKSNKNTRDRKLTPKNVTHVHKSK